jgi:hypothetical protein
VNAIPHPDEKPPSLIEDEKLKQRNKNMFKALVVGTLNQFQKERSAQADTV